MINLTKNRLESVSLEQLMQHAAEYPLLDKLVSIHREGVLTPPTGTYIDAPPSDLCITFDKLMSEGNFPAQIRGILKRLEGRT